MQKFTVQAYLTLFDQVRNLTLQKEVDGSALLSLELLSRDHAGVVNGVRSLLHSLANADPNQAVRRLAVMALKNGSPQPDTLVLLEHIADSDEEDKELRAAAKRVVEALRKKARAKPAGSR